jgi:Leucine-rich repeat (LRR) protein
MEYTSIGKESVGSFNYFVQFNVYPQLKSLYLGDNRWLSDERMIMFASTVPNLQMLDLNWSYNIIKGICQVLRRCCKITHLSLAGCSKVSLLAMNFLIPKLEVLNLSNKRIGNKTFYVLPKNCSGLLKHEVHNCKQLKKLFLEDCHISDKIRELFSGHGGLLC